MRSGRSACAVWALFLLLLGAKPTEAQDGLADYEAGLQLIATYDFWGAGKKLEAAIDADDEDADHQLALAIALMFGGGRKGALAPLERVRRLSPEHPGYPVWSYLYRCVNAWPKHWIHDVPHGTEEPYGRDLIHAATMWRKAFAAGESFLSAGARRKAEDCAASWAWRELARPDFLDSQLAALEALSEERKDRVCLGSVSRLLEYAPDNVRLLGLSARSKAAIGDHLGARRDLTHALTIAPTRADLLLGRALAAARTGGLRTALADEALLASMEARMEGEERDALEVALGKARALKPSESPAALLCLLEDSGGAPEVAAKLVRADAAVRLVREEAYTQGLTWLQNAHEREPGDVERAVALAAYCIQPAVEVRCRLAEDRSKARIRVGRPDLPRAEGALDRALRLAPNHHGALTQRSLLLRALDKSEEMIRVVEHALSSGALNYDLGKIYLDYYQNLAAAHDSEAATLRAPSVTYEERDDGSSRVTTPPGAAALVRAAELDQQAAEMRRRSVQPLEALIAREAETPLGKLAKAEVHRIFWEYDAAVASAEAALTLSPWHLEAREYLIDLSPKVGMKARAVEHADILDNLAEPSARCTLGPVETLLSQTAWSGVHEILDRADAKDPASGLSATLRAITLTLAGQPESAECAFRIAVALEEARIAMLCPGDAPLPPEDAALLQALLLAWARMRQVEDAPGAWGILQTLTKVQDRIPREDRDRQLCATALPTVVDISQDGRRVGLTVRQMRIETLMSGARLLMALDRLEESADALIEAREWGKATPWAPPVDTLAFPLIKKMGEERAARIFPPEMMESYRLLGRHDRRKETFKETETPGIDPAKRRRGWIRVRLLEIEDDLALVTKSQTYLALRMCEDLEYERLELVAELARLERRRD